MLNLSHVMLYPLYVHGSFYVFLWFLSFHSSEKNKKKQAIKNRSGAPDLQAARGKVPPWHPSRLAPKTQQDTRARRPKGDGKGS